MSHTIGLLIEGTVAVLLIVTISYCIVLNKRLLRLKADEMSLKATISELITATEIAERAVNGLKAAVRDCDRDLGERLHSAEHFSRSIAQQLLAGEGILNRLSRIVSAARPAIEPAPQPVPVRQIETLDPNAMLAAAQAFADRTRARVTSAAA